MVLATIPGTDSEAGFTFLHYEVKVIVSSQPRSQSRHWQADSGLSGLEFRIDPMDADM